MNSEKKARNEKAKKKILLMGKLTVDDATDLNDTAVTLSNDMVKFEKGVGAGARLEHFSPF